MMEIITCFISYILVFNYYGLGLSDIYNTASNYFAPGVDDFVVGDRIYDADLQVEILAEVVSAYFFNIWACQVKM